MNSNDFQDFSELWVAINEISANGKVLSPRAMEMAFTALKKYPFELVEQALQVHITRNPFAPTVASVIEIINEGTRNKRLSAHEVLPEMPQSEDDTVVWTPEAQQAWGNASKIKSQYDRNKSFVETYDRLCKESELLNRPITWTVSLGENVEARKPVLEAAYAKGRISQTELQNYLPAPRNITIEGQALITGNVEDKKFHPEFKNKLSEMWNLVDEAEKAEKAKRDAEKLAAEQVRRDKEYAAIALLPPEQQLALRNANLERYGNEYGNGYEVLH